MYYKQLLQTLSENNTYETCLSTICNPFSLYFLCNHYYGDEIKQYNIPIPKNKTDLLVTHDVLSKIKAFDIIHCQINHLNSFCEKVLDKINCKIILTTGQWHFPQLHKSFISEKILNHKNIILWVSQNPIYENSDKYLAFPYGIPHSYVKIYADELINNSDHKKKVLNYLPITHNTNICRRKLPVLPPISPSEYYKNMAEGKFTLSPIGDRDDCYRHYEAIGLGSIPISNVNGLYKNIFTTNMVYANIDEMVKMLEKNTCNIDYVEPNKDLICFEYYKNIVDTRIKDLKQLKSV